MMSQTGLDPESVGSCAEVGAGQGCAARPVRHDWLLATLLSLGIHAGLVAGALALRSSILVDPIISFAGGGGVSGGGGMQITLPEAPGDMVQQRPVSPPGPVMQMPAVEVDSAPVDAALAQVQGGSELERVPSEVNGLAPAMEREVPQEVVPHLHDEWAGPRIRRHLPALSLPAPSGDPAGQRAQDAASSSAAGGTAHQTPKMAQANPSDSGPGPGDSGNGGSGDSDVEGPRNDVGIPQPVYPPESRRLGEQGTVMLEVVIHADGSIGSIRVVSDAGFPRLAEAAVRAMRHAKLQAPTLNGQPIDAVVRVPFQFKLK